MKKVAPILALLLLEVYTVTSMSLLSKRGAVEDVKDDNGLKDLAKQLVKSKGSGYIDCDNILVWDALLQEENNQASTIETCGLCNDDEFLKMHMELFVEHCGYGKGGFPPICFNPAGWENLLYSFREDQLVKACALCDNGMFKRVHPEIFGENCEHEKEDTSGTAEDEDEEDEKEDTRGTAEDEGEEDEKEDTRGTAEDEDGEDEKEDTRGTAEDEDEEDEKEDTRGTAEDEDGEDEKEDTRGTAEDEDGEDEKEDTRGTADEEDEEDEKEDTRGTAEDEDGEDEEKSREVAEEEREEEEEEEDTRGAAEEEGGEDEEEAREVEPDHEEDTRGDKLDFIDKGKPEDDLVLAVEQFVRDTAKNMEALADRLDRYDKKLKIQEWKP